MIDDGDHMAKIGDCGALPQPVPVRAIDDDAEVVIFAVFGGGVLSPTVEEGKFAAYLARAIQFDVFV